MSIEFRDLKRQYSFIKDAIDASIDSVISNSAFISGQEVKCLEKTLADYVGRKHCISCANGTDAITIALIAAGIGEAGGGSRNDVVFVPDFTFFSSGECPATAGSTPVFVDVKKDTYNISPTALENAIKKVLNDGSFEPKAVIAVDLFGQPFEYDEVNSICQKYGLLLLEDAAQGFGGEYVASDGSTRRACKLGDISTTSFFPAKPLGCYGDGGAIFTDDDDIAMLCRSIAVHGKDMEHPENPDSKYNNVRLGMNSRLDTIQAGILLAKFPTFRDYELEKVNHVASLYSKFLGDIPGVITPIVDSRCCSSWAQYTVQLPVGRNRKQIRQELKDEGIPSNVYYIKPMHEQKAFSSTYSANAECPITQLLCETVLCLPIHPYLEDSEIAYIAEKLKIVLDNI